jgi:exodeoxyribonuclease VII small subunit
MTASRDEKGSQDFEPVGELSYMAASRELDEIVAFFEKSEVDVDQLVTRLERATAIVDELDRRIRRTRAQVEELVPKLEAAGRTASSDGADDEDRIDGDDADGPVRVDEGPSDGETLPL